MRARATSALILLGSLLVVGCGDDPGGGSGAGRAVAEATPGSAIDDAPAVEVAAGEILEVRFPQGEERGVPWFMSEAVGDGWSEPHYLLIAAAAGYGCDDQCPTWFDKDELWGWDDVAIEGSGPDRLLIPDDARSGRHRICTKRDEHCVVVDVVDP